MRRHSYRRSAIVLLIAAIVACDGGDSIGPTDEITLSFCPGTLWAGIQNEGQDWVTLASGGGDVTVAASERVIVATIDHGPEWVQTFYYLTRNQAEATFVCAPASAGTKQLSGSATGITSLGRVSLGTSTAGLGTIFNTYTLANVLDGPLDLVATHRNNAIIRRRVNYANGATIPVLDFASAEAFALQSHPLTLELNGLAFATWTTEIMTSGGTHTQLSFSGPPCCVDGMIYTLPANRQESGDLYRLIVGGGSGGNGRSVERYYTTPSAQAVVFGPAGNRPTFASIQSGGQLWRAEIMSQPEYGSQVELSVERPQPTNDPTTLVIKASKEHFGGTPQTWSFTIPDLLGVAGFPSGWLNMPRPGSGLVMATDAAWGSSPATARAGDSYRSAVSF